MRDLSESTVESLDLDALVAVLDDGPVRTAVLFGSYSRGEERTDSDVDVAVAFDESLSSLERTQARLELIDRIAMAIGSDAVDVVPLASASPELRREISEDGILLYGSSEDLEQLRDAEGPDEEPTLSRLDDVIADLERIV